MKKLYALAFTAFVCSIVHAQVKKGDIVLGGNLSWFDQSQQQFGGNATSVNSSSRNLSIAPAFGKVIKDNLILGFDIGYSNGRSDYTGSSGINSNGFSAGIFLRKYKPLGNGFFLFGQSRVGGGYTHSSQNEPQGNQPSEDVNNTYNFALQFFPGIAYALNQKWQLEAGLPNFFSVSYSNSRETVSYTNQPDTHFNAHSFSLQSSITGSTALSVGLRYFIGN